jgi:hypothetical protein
MNGIEERGHELMWMLNDDNDNTVHPVPSAGYVTFSPVRGRNIGGSADVFLAGGRAAIIHCIIGTEEAGIGEDGGYIEINSPDASETFMRINIANAPGGCFTFGPEGVRIPGGFSVFIEESVINWIIVYDIV